MDSPLDHLLEEGIISEVVGRLQSGKEAEVFLVRFGERIVAAKVYKDRTQRSFKNNSAYKEGRGVRNTRDQRAMGRRSRFGKSAEEDAWKSAEADALYRLHAAGVRVPTPVLYFEGVLLMELVVDAEGVTARRLIDTALSAEQANAAYHDMLAQLVRMLACDLIHGDLSPYNVLWGATGVTIIDFPQIVSAAQNSNSERFFLRDAESILGHFRGIDSRLEVRRGDAAEIWRAYMRRELRADFLPTGKVRPPPPQRPLPIAAPRQPSNGYGPPRPQNRAEGRSGQQQPAHARLQSNQGPPPQHRRGHAPSQQQRGHAPSQQQRGNAHSQQQRGSAPPQHQRGNAPSQHQRSNAPPQHQRGNAPPQHQRGNAPPRQQRGNAHSQQQRSNAPPQHQRGNAPARRTMPEVIVRPRIASNIPARTVAPSDAKETALPLSAKPRRP
jgi:RIO kinase 1